MVWARRHCEQIKSDMQDVKVGKSDSHSGRRAIRTSRSAAEAQPARREHCDRLTAKKRALTLRVLCVVHARTMEVLEPLGVTRDLLAEGVKVPIFRIRDRDRPLLTINFSEIPSSYQFTLMISHKTGSSKFYCGISKDLGRQCNAAMRTDPLLDVAIAD